MKNVELVEKIYSLGLTGSGIGVWWIKKENGKYMYYHTESSGAIYGLDIKSLPPSELYGEEWQKTADTVFGLHSSYRNILLGTMRKLKDLLAGKHDSVSFKAPWIDNEGKVIWVMDKVYVVDKTPNGEVLTVIGVTINESLRLSRREKYQAIEEINIKLRSVNSSAISLANLLVWSMNYDEFPNGDYIFCNDAYADALGLNKNKDSYVKYEDFLKTKSEDIESSKSMKVLLDVINLVNLNKRDEFLGVVVKHRNLKTNQAVYLEHYSRVDERYENGKVKHATGYILNITEKHKMEKENIELEKKNKELLLAQRLAVDSGKAMIWFKNSEDLNDELLFYGNELLFEKIGLARFGENHFSLEDFNKSIYIGDEEGKELRDKYFEIDDLVEENKLQSYSKVLVKHQNLITKELLYIEHSFAVEERYDDLSMKIRGGFMSDVTTETKYRKRIEFLVKHDLVTGLMNRNMFEEFIESPEFPRSYSLIVIDIDGLKFINDAFGHINGDNVIKLIGKVLKARFTDNPWLFRIGGDEFAVITKEINQAKIDELILEVKEMIRVESSVMKLVVNISVGYEIVINNEIDFNTAFTSAENIMYRRKLSIRSSRKSQILDTVLETLNTKTEETKDHCDRLGKYAVKTLKELGFSRTSDLEDIKLLSQVHDVGKITIAEEILSKESRLSKEEYDKIKTHSEAGYKIVKNIVESDVIADGVLYHHERVDGKGYPFGLTGSEIPLFAKIIAVCDSYDVMVTGRKYQTRKSKRDAIEEIERCIGTQFDELVAKAFIRANTHK